ncbi:hypothetical protein [Nocardioides zeae]
MLTSGTAGREVDVRNEPPASFAAIARDVSLAGVRDWGFSTAASGCSAPAICRCC